METYKTGQLLMRSYFHLQIHPDMFSKNNKIEMNQCQPTALSKLNLRFLELLYTFSEIIKTNSHTNSPTAASAHDIQPFVFDLMCFTRFAYPSTFP